EQFDCNRTGNQPTNLVLVDGETRNFSGVVALRLEYHQRRRRRPRKSIPVMRYSSDLTHGSMATNRSMPMISRWTFGIAIFISAFLLFQVQLLLGKFLLPWFGGTSAIWATCLLFFQVLLLAGYYYAHRISSTFRPAGQGQIHLAFLALTGLWILVAWFLWGSPLLPVSSW